MKVLHVTPAYEPGYAHGGPARSIPSLCRSLVRAGAEVTVFTTDANGPGPSHLDMPVAVPIERDGVTAYYFRRRWPYNFYYAPGLGKAVGDRLAGFDLVHIAGLWAYPGLVAGASSRRRGTPYIVSLRGMLMPWDRRQKAWKKRPFFYLSERTRLAGSAGLHCTSDDEKQALSAFGLEPLGFVIPNGLDVTELARLPERGALRARLGIPSEAQVLLFLGRLHAKKGIELTLSTFQRVAHAHPQLHLVMAGPDEAGYLPLIDRRATEWGLGDRIHATGELTGRDRLSAYADADLFMLLSESENFGMSVAEAMACGLPVIVTPGVGISGWVERSTAGVVVERDLEQVVQRLDQILGWPTALREMGENGRRLVASQFSEGAVGNQMLEVYRGVLDGEIPSPPRLYGEPRAHSRD
jgi:glycosyltransferase involved in cell wall biosynthesis